jgi:hypothetical protein
MVKTFGEAADFAAFKVLDGYIYRVAWAKTMQVEKTEDGQEKESSLCDYMLERYDYKPSMDFVLNDILASGEQASMEEIREISEGLGAEPLGYMKKAMLAYIEKYDASSSVNSFLLNGMEVWLDKATRVGLMNSTTIAKSMGQEKTTLWLGSYQLEVDCDKAIQLLSALEMYALECFNVTAAHKKAVSELDNIEGVLTYDYKSGYPDKLKMEV